MKIQNKHNAIKGNEAGDTIKVSNRDAMNSDFITMTKEQKALYREKMNRRMQAADRKKSRKADRIGRSRVLIHAGGILDMTGLLRYRFKDKSDYDNPQDDLRANLLCGAFLKLSEILSNASELEIQEITAKGKQFRLQRMSDREIPEVNPHINTEINED